MMNKEAYVVPSMKVEIISICDVITTSGGTGETGNNVPTVGNGGAGGSMTDSSWGDGW